VHFLHGGDLRSKAAASKMSNWARTATGGDPAAIRAGYELDGTPVQGSDYTSMAFVAPFGVAAMTDHTGQAWLDALWAAAIDPANRQGYYEDSINLLSLIAMSGNWWVPEAPPCP